MPVAPYFNGVFPSSAPGDPSGWAVVNAFPNLTFTDPLMLQEIPGQNQFLVVCKNGEIWRFPKSSATTIGQRTKVLDLIAATQTSEDQGFYSLAFHPNFGQAGQTGENYVYVCYSRKGVMGTSNPDASYWTLSRFTWVPASGTINPASELIMMSQFDPHRFHQGGALFFGNEGYLHVSVGDGGASADTFNNAQKLNMGFFAGILRIDVDYYPGKPDSHAIIRQPQDDPNWSYLGNSQARPSGWPASYSQGYGIPNDNPWLSPGGSALEEFYAVGLRSPHAAHYDPPTGEIWVGDVGQTSWEEISRVVKGSNCQWSYKEGPQQSGFRTDPNVLADVETAPTYSYPHANGNNCIIGGMRYRGTRWPALTGKVLFGDNGSGKMWSMTLSSGGGSPIVTEMLTAFGTAKQGLANICADSDGEVYMMDLAGVNNPGGRIMKLADPVVSAEPPLLLSTTGVFADLVTLTPAAGVIPYDVPNALWSDGAHKRRWIIAPNDGSFNTVAEDITFSAKGSWVFPSGTVFVKHFEVPVDANNPSVVKRLETRFLICTAGGGKYGLTYKWNAGGTDAELMTAGLNETYDYNTGSGTEQKTWSYPSRGDCLVCHNDVSGQALGVRTAHLSSDAFYPSTGRMANQLATFNSLGMFNVTLTASQIEDYIEARPLEDATAPLEHRVRSYLDTNCSHCHQPGAQGEGFDARLATSLVEQNLINGIPTRYEELGAAGRYIKPGDPSLSAVNVRVGAVGDGNAMPPLAKNIAHAEGVAALQTYVQGLTAAEFEPTLGPGPQARYVRLKSITGRRRYAAVAEFSILDQNGERIPANQITGVTYLREDGSGGLVPGTSADGCLPAEAADGNDGASNNFWQSVNPGGNTAPNHPHYLVFDLGADREIGGYKYFPRLTSEDGRIFQYLVEYSTNGTTWSTMDSGTWPNSASAQEYNPGYNKRPARVQVAGPSPSVMGPFDVTIAFDMEVENFTAADIQVTGGTVQKFRGSDYYYVARISPTTQSGSVQVSVPLNAADPVFKTGKGRLGKGSRASAPFSVVVVPDTELPDSPTNLAADPTEKSVALTWTAGSDNVAVTGYRVYRGNGPEPIATVTGTSYNDTGLDPDTSYLYWVKTVDGAGNLSTGSQITVSTDPDELPPSMPGSLAANPITETTVTLTWTASTDNVAVDGYRIMRGSTLLGTVEGLSFLDTGLSDGASYTYKVIAIDTSGNETEATIPVTTVTDTVAPQAPGNLAAVEHVTSIDLTWSVPYDLIGVTGYRIYRNGSVDPIATVTGTGFNDTGLNPETAYSYQVRAFDARTNLSAAATINVSTEPDEDPPEAPGSLTANPITETTVMLTWTASTDNVAVDGYRIERDSILLGTVEGLSFLDTGLSDGASYTYKVIAIDTSGNETEATIPVTTVTDTVAPEAPENLAAQEHVTSIQLTWTVPYDKIGVTSYRVYRDGGPDPIATVTGTTYTDTGLNQDTAYTYQVRALDARLNISPAASISASTEPDQDAPSMPGNLEGTPSMDAIQLSWDASTDGEDGSGVDRYRISRNGDIVGTVTGLTFTDTGLESGIEYDYQVVAIDEAGNVSPAATLSIETTSDSQPPSPPTELEADPDYAAVNLSWTAPPDLDVVGYEIYRSGVVTPIATVTTLSHTVSELASNTSFTFEVKAKDAAGLLSAAASVTVDTLGFDDWLEEHDLDGQLSGDSDGGSLDNFAEFRLGMDPADPADDLTFRLEPTLVTSGLEIVFPELKPVGHYYLHASSNLAEITAVESRIVSLSPEDIEALSPEQRDHYVVEIPATGDRKFVVLIFEPTPEE
ncbi:PQQ-dependent sugar dehydrogenase [Luteolibacter arcticus]|uniref:PQQ-dependent sugar dehydrogenase n=1 Tax=Luteolibacter arcticus TaxID=1581411 RepID=A0ABT3GGZ2_9BACT|nr:fibronectin type III domain-containing protein [Luteolibacter arcticus]MCW1922883.1 PQQ-dependent sugar dehydrogenase [Luteolibacter arcticus]